MRHQPFDRRIIPDGLAIGMWPAPDGWPLRRFAWAPEGPEPRGSILFVAGRADFIEKYLEAYRHWHGRGWHVAGFDWRGQGGSGRIVASDVGHLASLDLLVDDLAAVVADWRRGTPAPHVLIGHSMGGHLALRLLAEHHTAVDAAVLVAPMLGLNSAPVPIAVARLVTRVACATGLHMRAAWRGGDRPSLLAPDRQRNLTASIERYADERWWKTAHPELALGPPSFGWLAASYRSIARLDRQGALAAVRTPILLLGAEHDRLVSRAAIVRVAARLPDARLAMFADGAHELLREADAVRLAAFAAIDDFLDERAPAG